MEGDPPQGRTMNVRSSVLDNASSVTSSGEINSSGGDHNRINQTININQVFQRHPTESVDSGQRSLSRDEISDRIVSQGPSNRPDEERRGVQSSNSIYERHMLLRKPGSSPLWIPQPNNRSSSLTHRRKGVTIGDVGQLTSFGAFIVLFNICKPAGPPDNPDDLPDDFEHFVLQEDDIVEFQEYTSGSYITSASVNKLSGLTFRCHSSEGAILTMPDGAFREDLQSIKLFRKFIIDNAESWYRFVNGSRGWEVGNGELHLVTGCDKTGSWGLAAYQSQSDSSSNFGEPLLRFRSSSDTSHPVSRATYCWEHEGIAEVKAWPQIDNGEMPVNGNYDRNQCTFVRLYTITLSEAEWARVESTLVSAVNTRRALKPAQPKSKSYGNFLTDVLSSLGIFSSGHNTGPATMTDSRIHSPVLHPSTFIANMLLQKYPDAKVAIVHDDHWGAVIGESEDKMPTGPELWKRVQETFDIVLDSKRAIYLSERSIPPQHVPQLSNEHAHEVPDTHMKAGWSVPSIETLVDSLFNITPLAAVRLATAPVHPPIWSCERLSGRYGHQIATTSIGIRNMKSLDGLIEVNAKYPIACGGYADIYPGQWITLTSSRKVQPAASQMKVAIKVFRDAHLKANIPDAQRQFAKRLNNEYRVWALLDHPNVLPLLGLLDDPAIPSTGLVSPHCSFGDLRAFFSDPASASVDRLAIVKGTARGLTYVHQENVVHGDLTMNNILVEVIDGEFTPLLSDFGRSRVLEQAGYTSSIASATVHRHMPPEILTLEYNDRSTMAFTKAADVWCFSMVMLETLTGRVPFSYMNESQAVAAIAYGNKPNPGSYPAFPHDIVCWQIMERCWHREPSHRIEMPRLLQSLNDLPPDL